jgi:3'(2'), 5'-bisphosphate nucleotidase
MDREGEGLVALKAPVPVPLEALTEVVWRAGEEILRHLPELRHETKGDGSPVTLADRGAHALLERELAGLLPGVPILSEESERESLAGWERWPRFWLVDPLDGTRELLRGSGEFTVNVALVDGGRPVAGVVHAPALGRTFRAAEEGPAEAAEGGGPFRPIRARRFDPARPVVVGSRDHAGPGVEALARALGDDVRFTPMGSSLKFCLLAEGQADLYLRDLPTMQWDTGAAERVLEAAGGRVVGLHPGRGAGALRYGRAPLVNPPFLAVGDPGGPWGELLRDAGLTA